MGDSSFKQDLIDSIPVLRAFARSLSGDRDRADDLVQETLAKAIAKKSSFQQGTNLHAWLITILRNQYYSEGRKRQREVQDSDGVQSAKLLSPASQPDRIAMRDFLGALQALPDDQREALILVGANGFSYEEAAEILGTQVGTAKSRVSRARAKLESMMNGSEAFDRDESVVKKSAEELREAMNL